MLSDNAKKYLIVALANRAVANEVSDAIDEGVAGSESASDSADAAAASASDASDSADAAAASAAAIDAAATAVADLNQTISDPPTQAEVQAISDKVDELLAALRSIA